MAFLGQFYCPFTADLKDDALVGTGDVLVSAPFLVGKERIGLGISGSHVKLGHAHAGAYLVHGLVQVGLGQRPGLGLCLRKVQEYLGMAEDDKVYVGAVPDVLVGGLCGAWCDKCGFRAFA